MAMPIAIRHNDAAIHSGAYQRTRFRENDGIDIRAFRLAMS
jgi:hypothetical protein